MHFGSFRAPADHTNRQFVKYSWFGSWFWYQFTAFWRILSSLTITMGSAGTQIASKNQNFFGNVLKNLKTSPRCILDPPRPFQGSPGYRFAKFHDFEGHFLAHFRPFLTHFSPPLIKVVPGGTPMVPNIKHLSRNFSNIFESFPQKILDPPDPSGAPLSTILQNFMILKVIFGSF